MGRYGQYTALIPPGVIAGELREITVTSPDLCGLMDELDDLFARRGPIKTIGGWNSRYSGGMRRVYYAVDS